MNIVFLVSSLGAGGAERVAVTLSNAWVQSGHEVTLLSTFSGRGDCFYETSKSVDLVFLSDLVGNRSKNILTYIQRFLILRKFIQKKKPDVIISYLPNVNVAAILLSFFLKTPLICSEHTDPRVDERSKFLKFMCRVTYPFAKVMIVQTEAVMATIGNVYPNLKRVYQLPNPLTLEVQSNEWVPIKKERKVLLSLGRLGPEKQVDKIIKAFAAVAHKNPDWDLHIYGEGVCHDALVNLIRELNLNDRIMMMGRTYTPWLVMLKADIFVMSSKFEGFSNALLEAMGTGLPCVAFNCPSGPEEITRSGLDACLVPLDDMLSFQKEIHHLMQHESLRISLGKQARLSVMERYSLNKVLLGWNDLFHEVGVL